MKRKHDSLENIKDFQHETLHDRFYQLLYHDHSKVSYDHDQEEGRVIDDEIGRHIRLINEQEEQINSMIHCLTQLLKMLKENNIELFIRIVAKCGVLLCQSVLKEVIVLEKQGGLDTSDLSRRRSPGGTFIQLLKQRISKSDIKYIWAEQDKKHQALKKEKKKECSSLDKIVSQTMKESKQCILEKKKTKRQKLDPIIKLSEIQETEKQYPPPDQFSNGDLSDGEIPLK